jgi:hypothetical protein
MNRFGSTDTSAGKADADKKALQADKDALTKALHESELQRQEFTLQWQEFTLQRQEFNHKLLWRTVATAVICATLAVGTFIYLQKHWDLRCVIDKSRLASLQFEYLIQELALNNKIHAHKLETLRVEHLEQLESKDKVHKDELERLQFKHTYEINYLLHVGIWD